MFSFSSIGGDAGTLAGRSGHIRGREFHMEILRIADRHIGGPVPLFDSLIVWNTYAVYVVDAPDCAF